MRPCCASRAWAWNRHLGSIGSVRRTVTIVTITADFSALIGAAAVAVAASLVASFAATNVKLLTHTAHAAWAPKAHSAAEPIAAEDRFLSVVVQNDAAAVPLGQVDGAHTWLAALHQCAERLAV